MNRALALKNARAILLKRKHRADNTGRVAVFKPTEPVPADFTGLAIVLAPLEYTPTI